MKIRVGLRVNASSGIFSLKGGCSTSLKLVVILRCVDDIAKAHVLSVLQGFSVIEQMRSQYRGIVKDQRFNYFWLPNERVKHGSDSL